MRYFLLGLLLMLCSVAQSQNLEQDTTTASALFAQAEVLTPQGKFDSASLLYHKAASLVKPHKLWKKYFLYTLKQSTIFYHKGKYKEAVAHIRKEVLPLFEKELKEDPVSYSVALNAMGAFFIPEARFDEGLKYLQKALALQKKHLGLNRTETLNTYNNIGLSYGYLGKHLRAIAYQDTVLKIARKLLPPAHPQLGLYLNNSAKSKQDFGWYDEAVKEFEESLKIYRALVGDKHTMVSNLYGNLGLAYFFKGEFEKADNYLEKSLALRLELYGQKHEYIGESYNSLGLLYLKKGSIHKAIEYFTKNKNLNAELHGTNQVYTIRPVQNLGNAYLQLDDIAQANFYFHQQLMLCKKYYGEESTHTLQAYLNLGSTHQQAETYDSALYYYKKVQALDKKLSKNNFTPNSLVYTSNISKIYRDTKQPKKALELTYTALHQAKPIVSSPDKLLANLYLGASLDLHKLKKQDSARHYIELAEKACLAKGQQVFSKQSQMKDINSPFMLLKILSHKGFLLYAMEREREALEAFNLAVQLVHLGIASSERTSDKLRFAEQGYDAHRQAAYLHFLEAKR